jgi:Domain of unknown function (DUF3470)/Domain of unknown function DUF488
MALPFFTIGHSTRSIDEFVDLLSNAEVRLVVDVRTIPRSRTNPQYNSEALAEALSTSRIDYEHIAALVESWLKLNADYALVWPNITIKREPPADAKEFDGVPGKFERYFSPNSGQRD